MGRRSESIASKYGEMSKSRKGKRKAAPRPPVFPISTSAEGSVADVAPVATVVRTPSAMPRYVRRGQQAIETLSTDYGYVARDLRQIAITAVAMFAIIAVLYFVLR
ncbi:MAG: hypothetical protein EPO21_20200 [Chloroflexota bacterium]|nr:MAG: hypothetical protein EPO21_20200 [Chloroflexota bacterium]